VFKSPEAPVVRQLTRTVLTSGVSRLVEYGAFTLLHHYTEVPYLLLVPLILGSSVCVKYLMLRHWAFR
jgi:hypothetical protein